MAIKIVDPTQNFRGMSYGEWTAVWSNWLYSPYPRYFPSDDMIFLRGFLEFYDPQSEYKMQQFITERVVNGRRDPHAPPDVDSKYKDIVRTTEKRLLLNRDQDRDETFTGDIVPKDTAVFIPVITAMYWIGESFEGRHLENEQDVRRAVRTDTYESREIWAWYRQGPTDKWENIVKDGDVLKSKYRIESPMFTLRVSEDSQFSANTRVQPGNYDTVTGGYIIIIPDLEEGQTYYFRFGARGRDNYRTESHYRIKVDGSRRNSIDPIPPPPLVEGTTGERHTRPKDWVKDTVIP
jgi:hypothetical protein